MIGKKPVFCVDFRKGSFRETVSGVFPVVSNDAGFRLDEKGYGLGGSHKYNGINYGNITIPNSTYSIVIWSRLTNKNPEGPVIYLVHPSSVGYIRANMLLKLIQITSGTAYVDNVATTTVKENIFQCVVVSGITLENVPGVASLAIGHANWASGGVVDGNIPYVAIYEGTLSAVERDALYQDFLNSTGSVSTPNILKPRIEVDPKGTTLCYDFQPGGSWQGGTTVLDLSGNNNHGTVAGFVDATEDGAKFEGNKSYVNGGASALGLTSFTLETVVNIKTNTSITSRFLDRAGNFLLWKPNHVSNKVSLLLTTALGSSGWKDSNANAFSLNEEVHLITSYNHLTGLISFYSNGQSWGTATITGGGVPLDTGALGIGGSGGSGYSLDGSMKLFKIYNKALTEAEIKTKYNKIARQIDLQAMENNLLCDQKVYTSGQFVKV